MQSLNDEAKRNRFPYLKMMYTQVKQILHLHIFLYILPTFWLGFEILIQAYFLHIFFVRFAYFIIGIWNLDTSGIFAHFFCAFCLLFDWDLKSDNLEIFSELFKILPLFESAEDSAS